MAMDVRRLQNHDVEAVRDLQALFARSFHDPETYLGRPPRAEYLVRLLEKDHVLVLAAFIEGAMAGALVAYELEKLEQERSEIYLYDLAVDAPFRRLGVATTLIEHLRGLARDRGAWVVFVQADTEPEDEPAIALYTKLGVREEVLHFDIDVRRT